MFAKSGRNERRLAAIGLAGIVASFVLFASQFVRCVINNLWGDASFSGWSGPVGHQLVTGRQLFRDLFLPLPPGSFVVLAAIERWFGDGWPRLLHENWVCAVAYTVMIVCGYAIARPIVGARVALFTAAGTAGSVSVWIKELAYDPLAEMWAWVAVALLSHAWIRPSGRSERRLLLGAGLLTGTTLFFKQSTASGLFAGTLAGIASLAIAERRTSGALTARVKSSLAYVIGTTIGVVACLAAVRVTGGKPLLFLAAMFVDGAALKGGTQGLTKRALWSVLVQPMSGPSLAMLVIFAVIVLRVARHPAGFRLGAAADKTGAGSTSIENAGTENVDSEAPAADRGALAPRHVAGVVGLCAAIYGGGALLLALRARPAPEPLFWLLLVSMLIVQFSGCLTLAFVVVNAGAHATPASSAGHAFNALAIATLVLGTTVSMSMTVLNPVYEMNPWIAVSLIAFFVAMDRVRILGLRWALLAVVIAMPLGFRIPRASAATHEVAGDTFFRGMRVNDDGLEIVRAASLVRDLAGRQGRVLVLPEDPSFAALVGRRRPNLCGAIVFPDQYPARCLKSDLVLLARERPDVLVLRPAEGEKWLSSLRVFATDSPTEKLMTRFLGEHLSAYERAATFPTLWNGGTATLEVWRLRSAAVSDSAATRGQTHD